MGARSFQCNALFDHHSSLPLQNTFGTYKIHLGLETQRKYIWDFKNKRKSYDISWSIAKCVKPYEAGTTNCSLCIQEKLCIINEHKETLLNKRLELISKFPFIWEVGRDVIRCHAKFMTCEIHD